MVQVIFEMSEEQVDLMAARFDAPYARRQTEAGQVIEFGDSAPNRFVLRCVGTVLELERAQENGATLMMRNDRGVVRKLRVDVSHDGESLNEVRSSPFFTRRWWG